jgi:hypothetical protein
MMQDRDPESDRLGNRSDFDPDPPPALVAAKSAELR